MDSSTSPRPTEEQWKHWPEGARLFAAYAGNLISYSAALCKLAADRLNELQGESGYTVDSELIARLTDYAETHK